MIVPIYGIAFARSTDVNDRSKINPIRKEFFGAARPASTLIGVNELAIPGMKVEIEAVVGLKR